MVKRKLGRQRDLEDVQQSPAAKTERFGFIDVIIYLVMILIFLMVVIPFLNIIALSLSDSTSTIANPQMLWPQGFQLDAYKILFNKEVLRATLVTLFVVVANTTLHIVLCMMAAYVLSHHELPGRTFLLFVFTFAMLFNGGTVPFYLLIKELHLTDNILVYILPGVVAPYTVILMKNFINALPKSMEEAAIIDGAPYLTILFKIIFPLSKPIIATMALFNGVGVWNNWFSAVLFVKDKRLYLIQNVLREMLVLDDLSAFGEYDVTKVSKTSIQMSALIITIIPILLIYPLVQRYFNKGITIGSVKE